MNAKTYLALNLIIAGMLTAVPAIGVDLDAVPPAHRQNGITYITGGVGQPESTAMKAVAGRYDLALTFAERDGDFLDHVKVDIVDRHGRNLLDILSGPILLANLPSGRYTIHAAANGRSISKTVEVAGRQHRRLAYAWPNSRESEFSAFEPGTKGPAYAHPTADEASDGDSGY
jgi:hypothetical protein